MSNAGRYQENNVVDARTEPMVPFSFPDNNTSSLRQASLNNGHTRLGGERHNQLEGNYQISMLHPSSNIFFRTSQGMLQRPQNHHASLDNFNLGMNFILNICLNIYNSYKQGLMSKGLETIHC